MTELIVWDWMGLSCIHLTCYTDQREQFWSWNMFNYTKPEKQCVIEKLSSSFSKENGRIVISKGDVENCLGTINMCLFWIPLTMMTLSADWYCGTLSLQQPCFAKGVGYFTKVLSFCMKMPSIIHPTGQLIMAAHLKGYGSVPILHSVFYLSLNLWEAPGWQVIGIDADVNQVITSWL